MLVTGDVRERRCQGEMSGRGYVRERCQEEGVSGRCQGEGVSGNGMSGRGDVRERRCQGNGMSGKQDVRELDVKE